MHRIKFACYQFMQINVDIQAQERSLQSLGTTKQNYGTF